MASSTTLPAALLLAPLLTLAACAEPLHLGYDHGRAYTQAFTAQADLTRPSVQDLEHPLGGVEAQAIRLKVQEATTEAKSGVPELEFK